MDNPGLILSNITSLIPPISKLIEYRIIRHIQENDIRSRIRASLQKIQYEANIYHATFYTLDNYKEPYMTLMDRIRDTHMLIKTSTNYLSKKEYKEAKKYLVATYDNLIFSVDRLNGNIKHEEWRILPDKEQQSGHIFILYQKVQNSLK